MFSHLQIEGPPIAFVYMPGLECHLRLRHPSFRSCCTCEHVLEGAHRGLLRQIHNLHFPAGLSSRPHLLALLHLSHLQPSMTGCWWVPEFSSRLGLTGGQGLGFTLVIDQQSMQSLKLPAFLALNCREQP